jgi:hypothetical protein
MYDKVQGEASIHNIGSLTVSIPLSITLVIISIFRGSRPKPAMYTTYPESKINAEFEQMHFLASIHVLDIIRNPLLQTSSRSKKSMRKGRRPGAEANVYNTTVKSFFLQFQKSQSKRPTWVSKMGYNKPRTVALVRDIHEKNGCGSLMHVAASSADASDSMPSNP